MGAVGQAMPTTAFNPYADDHNAAAAAAAAAALGAANSAYFPQNAFTTHTQPLLHHLYFPAGPHKEDLLPYQRTSHDFFMSEKLRQDLQKKAEAARQVISTLESRVCSTAIHTNEFTHRYRPSAARQFPQPRRSGHLEQEERQPFWVPELGVQGGRWQDGAYPVPQET